MIMTEKVASAIICNLIREEVKIKLVLRGNRFGHSTEFYLDYLTVLVSGKIRQLHDSFAGHNESKSQGIIQGHLGPK